MTIHRYYAAKRDGKIHPATICATAKAALEAARIYCHNAVADRPDQESNYGQSAWNHLLETGRVQVVEIECRERRATTRRATTFKKDKK